MSASDPGRRGVSLPEVLVVVAILALGILVTVPLVAEKILGARIRAAAEQYAVSLRAARMVAVSRNTAIDVTVEPEENRYRYEDSDGSERTVQMPPGVEITIAPSASPIRFLPNGSIDANAAVDTVLRADMGGGVFDVYTVTTSVYGIPTVSHHRGPDE